MRKPERIYVAGPYSSHDTNLHDSPRITQHNVDKAVKIAIALIEKGHYICVPHLSHYIHTNPRMMKDMGTWWYIQDNTFIDHWATALFYMSPSYGTDLELERAKKLGLKIYKNLDEVPNLNDLEEPVVIREGHQW